MSMRRDRSSIVRQTGISLVELVMFIVVVSVGLAGILSVMNVTTKSSADPMIRKQALSIAESLLEEVELQAYTWCFPSDPNAATATGTGGCSPGMSEDALPTAARVSNVGAREGQNVSDYRNFAMGNPIRDVNGNAIGELAGYGAAVAISQVAFNGIGANDTLKIDVTVTGPSDTSITLTGYRMRYAPNALP
ncbi:MAG: type II secretion system protein [Burkholderiaceae bacterium]